FPGSRALHITFLNSLFTDCPKTRSAALRFTGKGLNVQQNASPFPGSRALHIIVFEQPVY
ncbi:MAG: hypothetical protein ABIJ95_01905, partial [Pseudomonadota bacterium]